MTFQQFSALIPQKCWQQTALGPSASKDISVVIPVKNNRTGVHRLLSAWLETHALEHFPREIILVDNDSCPPLQIAPHYRERGLPVVLLTCSHPGPAAARNVGWQAALANWVLFLDSDCLPTETTLTGYLQAANGAIGYAGSVYAARADRLSFYYEQQAILIPPAIPEWTILAPASLVTANALVLKSALQHLGGFDERFPEAAGEDVDLGYRLWQIGSLAYAPEAQVAHSFEPGIIHFLRRFIRYGRGNRLLSQLHQVDLTPHPFPPVLSRLLHYLLAFLQYLCLWWGYQTGRQIPAPRPRKNICSSFGQGLSLEKPATKTAIALFIDGDNISPACLSTILAQEQNVEGSLILRRVYRRALPDGYRDRWGEICAQHHVEIVTVHTTERNATDHVLMQDIHFFLQNQAIHHIWLASGDGGYAPLVRTLMKQGYKVLIFGPQATALALKTAGTDFRRI